MLIYEPGWYDHSIPTTPTEIFKMTIFSMICIHLPTNPNNHIPDVSLAMAALMRSTFSFSSCCSLSKRWLMRVRVSLASTSISLVIISRVLRVAWRMSLFEACWYLSNPASTVFSISSRPRDDHSCYSSQHCEPNWLPEPYHLNIIYDR